MKLRTKSWLAVTATAGLVLGGVSPALAAGTAGPTEHTDMGVSGDAVMEHLQKISDISTSHADEGFRALGTPGYEEAVEYVESTLEATGAFDVKRQAFDVESQDFGTVDVNSTFNASPAIWTAFQILFESREFAKFQSREYATLPYCSLQLDADLVATRFIFATESYGGHYGPEFVTFFNEQNAKIREGKLRGELITVSALMINKYVRCLEPTSPSPSAECREQWVV